MTKQTEALKELLSYNKETGIFVWTDKAPHKVIGKVAGSKQKYGHLVAKINGVNHLLHRLAWMFVYGVNPVEHIDHINGNPSDNKIENLRLATRSLNMQNLKKAKANNKCGLLGVCPNGDRWKAEIRIDGKKTYLGTFDTALEAHNIYLTAKRQHHVGNTL
jgi:hypothetical protein